MLEDNVSRLDDKPIDVLFVDDNAEWAELAASRIEREAEEINVTVAGHANEAMVILEDGEVDCLVADYMMPRINGIQLLERVRGEYPQLPYLLITSEGSEDVAARAIEAGVTDYIVKDPASNQTVLFVSRIRSAVEQYRLRRAVEESEARYRTVFEQSRDAFIILQQRRVVFGNQRLAEITGRDKETLHGSDIVETVIHPEERERARTVLDNWYGGRTQRALHEARIVQPDGTVRQCECTGRRITYEGEPALLVTLRDVTERQRRERELQWERELNRTVQETLVESRTREALEREIAAQLCQYGYSMAWIGEKDGSLLVSRTVSGDDSYLDEFDRTLDDSGADSEPSVWAARTGEPRFISDFDTLFATDWHEAADKAGYRGGAAIPLVYNDVTYGVLAVYHDRPDRFDETERHLLMELADTVAFAIHSLETEQTLAADRTVIASIHVTDESYYLVALAREGAFLEFDEVRVEGTVPHDDDAVIQYVTVDADAAPVRETLLTHPDVTDVVVIEDKQEARFQVKVTGPVPEAHLASQGILVESTSVETDGATIEVELSDREPVRKTVDTLEAGFDDVSVLSVAEDTVEMDTGRSIDVSQARLTDKQIQALQAAYYHGYFQRPRGNTASAIADSLGVSHSTFLQHLHRAQQKLFQQLL